MNIREIKLIDALSLSKKEVISIIGGGGKTSLAEYLSREIHSLDKQVISTTTTKIFPPRIGKDEISIFTASSSWLNRVDASFRERKLIHLAVDMLPNGKLKGLSSKLCKTLLDKSNVDYLVIEADGSRGKSIKGHSRWEPVVPPFTTIFIAVLGIDCLYQKISDEHCHRTEILCKILNCLPGELISKDLILNLFNHPKGYLKKLPSGVNAYVFINKVHRSEEFKRALTLGEKLLSSDRIRGVFIGHLKPLPDKITFLTD